MSSAHLTWLCLRMRCLLPCLVRIPGTIYHKFACPMDMLSQTLACRPKQQAAEEAPAPPASGPAAALPPSVLEHHGAHGGLTYQLHYRLQAA